jgi:hypothetical protein
VTDTHARLWHPWLRINRVLRVLLHTRWSAEAWSVVRVEFRRALALRSEIRRAGWQLSMLRDFCRTRSRQRGVSEVLVVLGEPSGTRTRDP